MDTLPWLLSVLLAALCLYIVLAAYRRYQRLTPLSQAGLLKIIAAHLLTTIAFVAVGPQLHGHWPSVLALTTVHGSAILTYLGYEQVLNQRRTPLYTFRHLVVIIGVLALLLSGASLIGTMPVGAYLEDKPVTLTWADYVASGGAALVLMYMLGRTARLCGQYARRYQHLSTQARLAIIWCANTLLMTSGLFSVITLLLLATQRDQFRPLLNQANLLVVAVACVLMPFSVTPEAFFVRLLRPVARYQQREQARLQRLHQAIIQIVPVVQFDDEQFRAARVLIEISDGRQLIWSHQGWTRTPTPGEEAQALLALLDEQHVITQPGAHPLPPMPADVERYNHAVAQVFDRLHSQPPVASN